MTNIYRHHGQDYENTRLGEAFALHMDHMTSEKLNSKSDIAWELAHRDLTIEKTTTELQMKLDQILEFTMHKPWCDSLNHAFDDAIPNCNCGLDVAISGLKNK